jgi:hypothetical protein
MSGSPRARQIDPDGLDADAAEPILERLQVRDRFQNGFSLAGRASRAADKEPLGLRLSLDWSLGTDSAARACSSKTVSM